MGKEMNRMDQHEASDLVRLCTVDHDLEAWNEFLQRFQNRLHAGVRRALARCEVNVSEHDREDLVQEVFCRLLDRQRRCLRLCRGTEEASIGAYLGRVAENVVLDHIRSMAAAKRGRDRIVDVQVDSTHDPIAEAPDWRANPEERLLGRERQRAFVELFRRVVGKGSPERDWQVFQLAIFQGFSSREICEQMGRGLRPSTVDSLIHRLKCRFLDAGVELPRRSPSGFTAR
jgi:RNA polymerase sigma factor (sigma-70 family)